MKFLVVGLGSMGKRRIRNLIENNIEKNHIFGFDISFDRRKEALSTYDIKIIDTMKSNNISDIDAFIISTPPDQHLKYILMAIKNGKDFFVEASVILNGIETIPDLITKYKLVGFPSCTMRYFEGPKKIKKIVKSDLIGKIYFWQYQSGQYLPDWHPWESYKDFYVSNPNTGGCREIVPFELIWLTDQFGEIIHIDSKKRSLKEFSKGLDDIYLLQIYHKTNVYGQLTVDILSRVPTRFLRITGSKGSLLWNDEEKIIKVFNIESKNWTTHKLDDSKIEKNYINSEIPYINEIKDFLKCIKNRKNPIYNFDEDIKILNLLKSAEVSSNKNKTIYV